MSFKFEVIEPKLYSSVVAEEIVACIQDCLLEKERCVIALSGGSTPVSIYRTLALPPYVDQIDWAKVDLVFGDERWVPADDVLSNQRMVEENLLSRLRDNLPTVYAVNTALSSPELAAQEYEVLLKKLCTQVDLLLLGMGEDGHMASVFPSARCLRKEFNQDVMVTVEDWPDRDNSYRISLTPKALLSAKKILFLVKGQSKASTLLKALNMEEKESLPVHIFRAVPDKVRWLLDSEAAQDLWKLPSQD